MDPLIVFSATFAVLGLFTGGSMASFACVVAERVPAGRTLGGRSFCGCGRQLRASENIPLIGWLRARGVAPCCGATIPARLVLAEAVVGLLGAALFGSAAALAVSGTGTTFALLLGASALLVACAAAVIPLLPAFRP